MRRLSLLLAVALGCSCPDAQDAGPDSATPDASSDSFVGDAPISDAASDVGRDTIPPGDAGPPPWTCTGEPVMNATGSLSGAAFGDTFTFPFITVGIEPAGGLSCPRVFIRAGDFENFSGPDFPGPYFEIEVPYSSDALSPGPATGTITWFFGDGEASSEEIIVNVTRADGLFENELPESERRIEFSISHHDATTDFDGEAIVATYCSNFFICI